MIQRKATRFCNRTEGFELQLQTPASRSPYPQFQWSRDLIQVLKNMNSYEGIYQRLSSNLIHQDKEVTLKKCAKIYNWLNSKKMSMTSRGVDEWNLFPEDMVSTSTVNFFKRSNLLRLLLSTKRPKVTKDIIIRDNCHQMGQLHKRLTPNIFQQLNNLSHDECHLRCIIHLH